MDRANLHYFDLIAIHEDSTYQISSQEQVESKMSCTFSMILLELNPCC